jgi:hypothetical protein
MPEAVAELARIMRVGGQVSFMMHHPDSYIMQATNEDLLQAKLIFNEQQLFIKARQLLEAMGDVSNPEVRAALNADQQTLAARDQLNQAVSFINQATAGLANREFTANCIAQIKQLFVELATASYQQRLAFFNQIEQAAQLNLERLDDLLAACITPARKADLEQLLIKAGFEIDNFEAFYQEQQILAWQLSAHKTKAL